MKSFIRSIVASPKQLHYDANLGLELDLSYITPNIIVCSGPVNSSLKAIYRYPIGDLVKFLEANHGQNWHIWNFRGEDQGYDNSDVSDKMTYLPFPDHQPPTLRIIEETVRGIDEFLQRNETNVVVLHCKAGKGRSGTLCCAYLMYKYHYDVATSIKVYTAKRMRDFAGDGVSIISQKRYLDYWGSCLSNKRLYKYAIKNTAHKEYSLSYIKLAGPVPALLSKSSVSKLGLQLFTYRTKQDSKKHPSNLGVETELVYSIKEKDITIEEDYIIISPSGVPGVSVSSGDVQIIVRGLFYSWVNLYCESVNYELAKAVRSQGQRKNSQPFVDNSITVNLKWEEMDGYRGTQYKGNRLFDSVEIKWN